MTAHDPRRRVFDVHAHVVPAGLVAELRGEQRHGVELVRDHDGSERLRIAGRVTSGPLRSGLLDLDARVEWMDDAGVDVQLLSPFVDTTAYALPSARAPDYARWFNAWLTEAVDAHADRFVALATVPLGSPRAAAAELEHAVTVQGMAGCEIATTVDGNDLDGLDLDPFWATATELGCLVLLHPYRSLEGRGVARYFLNNLVGNPAETTIAVAHLILSGTLERHPGLRLCVVHGGGFLPYQLGRLDRGFRAKPDVVAAHLTRSPAESARTLLYDTVTHAPDALAFLVGMVGSDHVVLGSDQPFEMGDPDPVATVEAIPQLTPDDRDRILGGNVAQLLSDLRR